jgi:tetratricopeptide (TPR) repeat protein
LQNDNHSINKHQIIFRRAGRAFANYFLTYTQTYQDNFEVLDQEFANLQTTRAWLAECNNYKTAQQLFTLIKSLTIYLRQRALNNELLTFCESGLLLCERMEINPGWLLLLRYEAYNALGEWELALADAQTAVEVTQNIDPITHARSILALGRLQLNQGDYRISLNTLAKAVLH